MFVEHSATGALKSDGSIEELLKEAVPNADCVAALGDPSGSVHSRSEVEAVPKGLGVQLQLLDVRDPKDVDRAFPGRRAR